jgi:putative DNA primase/helicase
VFIANGNNVTIGADTVRRTLQIRLDANAENPETRTFARDPVAEVLADRGPAVAAVLTVARAYRVGGMPGKLPRASASGSGRTTSGPPWCGVSGSPVSLMPSIDAATWRCG